jgi:hypothetical protein
LDGGFVLAARTAANDRLLTVDHTSATGNDVEWKVFF